MVKVPPLRAMHLFVVGALHGRGIAARIERDLEARRRDGPCVGGARNDVRRVVDRLSGVGPGRSASGDLVADAGLLLVPVGEGSLAGDSCGAGRGLSTGRAGGEQGKKSKCAGKSKDARDPDCHITLLN